MSFTIFCDEKTPFQAIKTKSSKSLKNEIFPNGLTYGFGTKMAIFFNFFFQAIQARKMSFTIFQNEKTPFFMVLVKNWLFFKNLFFQAIQARKMSLTIFKNDKTPFQAIKTRKLKSLKINIFPKGLTHGFCTKLAIFFNFFFQAIQPRKMSFTIFQNEKTPFQAIKTSSKRRKIDIFTKGFAHGFR